MTVGDPELRKRIRRLLGDRWREPVTVVYLGDVSPAYEVPGRRGDGTVVGQRLVRRFFWNLFKYTFGAVASAALSIGSGTAAHVFVRFGRVRGPAQAQALGLVDAARTADNAWLAYAPSHVAVVDSGYSFTPPSEAEPRILWQAAAPDAPRVTPIHRRLSWPDGSEFTYHVSAEEVRFLRRAPRQ